MAEAALVMPLFLAVLLGAVRILVICYQGIRLQYEVSETMRMTFTLDKAARSNRTWGDYFPSTLFTRVRGTGVSIRFYNGAGQNKMIDPNNYKLSHTNSAGTTQETWTWPGADALPGETVSVTILSPQQILPAELAGISSASITLRAKAVAVIHRTQDE